MQVDAMTSHYIDIQLRPDPEIAPHQLMNSLYLRLHRALVQLGGQGIGVSFPAHDERRPDLGQHLRLHGTPNALKALADTDWLKGIKDHLHIGLVSAVPHGAAHRQVLRVQAKSNAERLRRRAMKRHGIDAAEAARRIPDHAEERLKLPFVTLGSRSTGQPSFPLFLRHGPVQGRAVEGEFNTYGLSMGATVPWF
jgi:CRISPR-associated endonuclease Csy4